ncbi:MAG: HPP family protein [Desulfobacteraceae bacterium]|jgi:CBS-domain-containing membrane protein
MKGNPTKGPQHTFLYRLTALFSKLQFRYLHQVSHRRDLITAVYLFSAGVTALSTITMMAYVTDLMLLFPPLGPSAFILFSTPLSESACPRNLVLSHSVALAAGLGALALVKLIFPGLHEAPVDMAINWPHVIAIAIAMGGSSIAMVVFRCVHPPAVATGLIAAMGYLGNIVQMGGVWVAVLFLAVEAIVFNRIFGGLPYPFWRFDPNVDKMYRPLAGQAAPDTSRWQKMAQKTFHRR